MKKKKDRILQLRRILSTGKKLLIFNHFNPDPDSLTASLILSEIAKRFNVKSKIIYSGKISYSKNMAMVIYLNLNIYPYILGEEKKFDLIASVDTQKGMSNNAIPKEVFPDLTFDHHPKVNMKKKLEKNQKILYDIRTQYGSASSILLEYYLAMGFKLPTRIATAFCYTTTSETNHFTRKYNKTDVYFYRQAVQQANLRLISKIENIKRPVIYFQILSQVIQNHKKTDNLLTCSLGNVSNPDFFHEIANFMLTMDEIEFVAITGINNGVKKICCRSNNPKVHLGNILKAALEGIGSGGGHETMAAGEFTIDEKKVITIFKTYLKKFRVIRKTH